LNKIPIFGTALFTQSAYVLAAMVLSILLYLYFRYTRLGLSARCVGENPGVADSCGINVMLYKYVHILAGGFLCGIGGGFLTLVFVPRWQENITAGAGWIAVALVIFSTWNPLKALAAAYVFGALRGIGFYIQNANINILGRRFTIYPQLFDMLPYLATIAVLVLITGQKKKEYQAPAGLGIAWFREER
jgi:simple sugar transport system permease protein